MANLKEVNFLDVTFNRKNGTFCPYKKPNDKLLYIHTSSNPPSEILKQIPNAINGKLSHSSSDQAVFNSSKVEHEDALKKSGYKVNLKFTTKTITKPKKNRQRHIIWFNPSFSKRVNTNVTKIFFRLLDKHFSRTNRLHKIFNRNTVKA